MFRRYVIMALFVLFVSFALASSNISITGSTTVYPILVSAAEAYMNLNPEVTIEVQATGSSVGIAGILGRRVDIGAASRQIKQKELDRAHELGVDPVATVIAMDGIAVVVHPANPVSGLSIRQLTAIYTGETRNWQAFGGSDASIQVVTRDEASGTFEVFREHVLGDNELFPGSLVVASNQSMVEVVRQSENAVGFIGVGYLDATLKALSIDGQEPTVNSILSGRYALARPLNLYTDGQPEGFVAGFIGFILSPEGQRIVRQEGFVAMK